MQAISTNTSVGEVIYPSTRAPKHFCVSPVTPPNPKITMPLSSLTPFILLAAILLLILTGLFPSPWMIGLTAGVSSLLVLWQAYAILRDDTGPVALEDRSKYKGYLRK